MLRQGLPMRLTPLAARILTTASAATFPDEPGCKLAVPFPLFPGRRPGVPHISISVLIYSVPCAAMRILDRNRLPLPDVPHKNVLVKKQTFSEQKAGFCAPPTRMAVGVASFNKLRQGIE